MLIIRSEVLVPVYFVPSASLVVPLYHAYSTPKPVTLGVATAESFAIEPSHALIFAEATFTDTVPRDKVKICEVASPHAPMIFTE